VIQCQLKLQLRPSQEGQLRRWLWHLTAVHNWAVRKVGHDAEGGIYHTAYGIRALLAGHSDRLEIPSHVVREVAADALKA
jgi:hypothetical protein